MCVARVGKRLGWIRSRMGGCMMGEKWKGWVWENRNLIQNICTDNKFTKKLLFKLITIFLFIYFKIFY